MEQWRTNLGEARKALEGAQAVQKEFYDRDRKDVQFALGDRLLISKKHLSLPMDRDVPWKLRSLYDGDYPVTRRFSAGPMATHTPTNWTCLRRWCAKGCTTYSPPKSWLNSGATPSSRPNSKRKQRRVLWMAAPSTW